MRLTRSENNRLQVVVVVVVRTVLSLVLVVCHHALFFRVCRVRQRRRGAAGGLYEYEIPLFATPPRSSRSLFRLCRRLLLPLVVSSSIVFSYRRVSSSSSPSSPHSPAAARRVRASSSSGTPRTRPATYCLVCRSSLVCRWSAVGQTNASPRRRSRYMTRHA